MKNVIVAAAAIALSSPLAAAVEQAAVDQQIVSQGFLGQYAPAPGHG